MAANDVVLLQGMVEKSRVVTAGLSDSEQEAYFVATHYLSQFKPSHDDLLSGIVDGSRDGGIDGAYIFVNGYCVRDDTSISALGKNAHLELVLTQVKNSASVGESAIDKLMVHLPMLLDFTRDDQALSAQFNPRVIEVTRRFLEAYRALEMPTLAIYVGMVALKAEGIHPNIEIKAEQLRQTLLNCFGNCGPTVSIIDAAAMIDYARTKPPTSYELTLAENPISTDMAGGYVGLVKLDDYQSFITDESGKLDATLFDANVRDYEGDSGVNKAIQATLSKEDNVVDFWWLNNGVTIVAERVQPAGKILKLESPQIVNGLQTSHEVFRRLGAPDKTENRGLLVKVIQVDSDPVKDRIIRATNSQTLLGLSSLRATDRVQREIEEFLKGKGLYYERRKNFYHNRQIPLQKLVSVDQLGQAILTILVQAPHIARGEPTKIFQDDIYPVVFNSKHPLTTYHSAIMIVRTVEQFLREGRQTQGHVEDFLFHLSMAASIALTRKKQPSAKDLEAIGEYPSDQLLGELITLVREAFARAANESNEILFERLAKSKKVTQLLNEKMSHYLATSRRTK